MGKGSQVWGLRRKGFLSGRCFGDAAGVSGVGVGLDSAKAMEMVVCAFDGMGGSHASGWVDGMRVVMEVRINLGRSDVDVKAGDTSRILAAA